MSTELSPYVRWLRSHVGSARILVPGVLVGEALWKVSCASSAAPNRSRRSRGRRRQAIPGHGDRRIWKRGQQKRAFFETGASMARIDDLLDEPQPVPIGLTRHPHVDS